LSCNNTNITIPYIDLVNDILESAISPPAVPVTLIDTTGTIEERRAIPQQISQEAYALTANAVFPLVLPFDLAFARTTAYINALGTTRASILSLFASNPPTATQGAAIAGASLGINPEMQAIINGTDTHNPWDYWGLAVDQATVIDPKTRTTITLNPAGWVTALSKVPVLLNRAAITLQELYQLLEVVWVTESGVALEVGTTQNASLQILNPDTDLMVFTGLTADVLTRANSFLRLWAASGLQMWELDWAIKGFGNSLAGDFLVYLTGAMAVRQQLKLPFQEVLGFWQPLETRDVVSYLGDEDTVVPSTYSEVFLNPAVLVTWSSVFVPLSTSTMTAASSGPSIVTSLPHGYLTGMQVSISGTLAGTAVSGIYTITVTGSESFTLGGFARTGAWAAGGTATGMPSGNPIFGGASDPPTAEQLAISAALGLSAADISAVITFSGAANTLSLGTLGQLLNYQRLASSLSLDIPHLILWITLTSGKPFGWEPKDTQEFLRRLAVLQGTGLAAEDLNYLLLNQSPGQSSLALTVSQAAAILQTVRDAVAKLPGATAIPITGASNTSPITVTTASPNALVNGAQVGISGVEGNTAANGTFIITAVSPTSFTLNGSTGNGTWTSGGTVAFQAIPADPSMVQTIVINALTAATGTTATVITPVLLNTGVLPLAATTIDLLIAQVTAVDPTQFATLIGAVTAVAKAASLFNALKMTEAEFAFAMSNAVTFNWLDPSLRSSSPVTDPYSPFEALLRAIHLNRRQSTVGSALFDVLGRWLALGGLPTNLTTAVSALVPALNTNLEDLQSIVSALGATPAKLPAQAGSLTDMAMLTSIANALDTAVRYRIGGATLADLAAITPVTDTASKAMTTLQAQYPQGSWFAAIQPVEDVLRQNRRDALVAYMIGAGPAVPIPAMLTTDDIYDYYLIDPEMSPCGQTTRLLQPSLAIQQFVQQCFLNLTFPGGTVDMTSPLWDEWSWRQQYRLWQANREVFLYPENYVLPETRMDASSLFEDLENQLRQTNADADAAESAMENYIKGLVSVGRLHVAAVYNETKKDQSTVLHVFARTHEAPWNWYYRTRTSLSPDTGSWSAWESLNLDIGAQHLIPCVWDGRMYLIWAVFRQSPQIATAQPIPVVSPGTNTYPPQPAPEKFWTIQFSMSELSVGKWQAKRTIENKVFVGELSDPLTFTFRAFQDGLRQLNILVYSSILSPAGYAGSGVIAQVVLPYPDSPASVSEVENIPPNFTLVDTNQEPSFDLISRLTDPGITIATPTRYTFSGQDLTYQYGDDAFTTPENLNVLCTFGASGGSITVGSIELLGTVTQPRIVYPLQEAYFDSLDPFFVDDPGRTYLVQPQYYVSANGYQEIPNHAGATQWYTRYAFHTFYCPFARTLLRELESYGIPGLMARSLQLDPQGVRGWGSALDFNFAKQYNPGPQVKARYPGDPPLFWNQDQGESALDFAVGSAGAYSIYNWEIFYHVPMFVASLLLQNQQYQDALTWLEYIFNPTDNSGTAAPQRFGRWRPSTVWRQATG
jgi:Neuraminidase-like domain